MAWRFQVRANRATQSPALAHTRHNSTLPVAIASLVAISPSRSILFRQRLLLMPVDLQLSVTAGGFCSPQAVQAGINGISMDRRLMARLLTPTMRRLLETTRS